MKQDLEKGIIFLRVDHVQTGMKQQDLKKGISVLRVEDVQTQE